MEKVDNGENFLSRSFLGTLQLEKDLYDSENHVSNDCVSFFNFMKKAVMPSKKILNG